MKSPALFAFAAMVSLACCAATPPPPVDEPPVRAQLTSRRMAALSAEISAKVGTLHVVEGGGFHAGDLLVSFDDSLQRAQLDRAQAVLTAAEKTHTANQRLRALNSIGQVELELAEAEIGKARAELDYAAAMLARCRIRAPFSGRIAEQRIHEQEFVQAGQVLFEIIDDAPPEIDFIAPSKWLAWVRAGQPLVLHLDETGRDYPAVVERIGAKVDAVSQSVKIVAGVRGAFPELVAGMSGAVTVSASAP